MLNSEKAKVNRQIWFLLHKKVAIVTIVIVFMLTICAFLLKWQIDKTSASPVPKSINSRLDFKVIYPHAFQIKTDSWSYLESEKTLAFTVQDNKVDITFTQQKTPLAYQDDETAYNRFIGTLRPLANFKVPLGDVSIVSFVEQGSYNPVGRTGILNAQGTMLLVHPEKEISEDDWLRLFRSLKAD
jgi:hypothetical protein